MAIGVPRSASCARISPRALVTALLLLGLALVPPIAAVAGQGFYLDLFTRIMIFAIAALSLDIILGYGGMVSFGHAAYLGIGAYAVGILAFYGIDNGFLQFGTAVLASMAAALCIGFVSLRTSGVYFIMITLAFAQMFYFLGVSLKQYGGDDGMQIATRSEFGLFSI
ncbi:MAG: branched-chain amino acid ABC transporter permease, partial [Stellaceae bacterium]